MKRRDITRRCKCPCNRELKDRYKGREKIFFDSPNCRPKWHGMSDIEQELRLKQMADDIEKEHQKVINNRKEMRKNIKKK